MLRAWLAGLLLVGCAGCTTTQSPSLGTLRSPSVPPQLIHREVQTIVIDAGHGGRDPGTSHHGLQEKHLNLDIVRRLRAALEARGLRVVLTRDRDQFIPLSKRPALANRLNADLFVSVHINANRNAGVSGVEVYYPRVSVVSPAASWPPEVHPSEIALPSVTVKQVLWDLVLRRTRVESRKLASSICRSMRDGLQASCRATRPARFVVLREAWMPSVLVEVGYVSNPAEAQRLGTAAYRQAAAESIAQGIVTYIRALGTQHI